MLLGSLVMLLGRKKSKKMSIYIIYMSKKPEVEEEYANKQIITNTKRFFFKKKEDGLSSYIKKGTNDSRTPTHRLFDGGNLHINKEDMEEFYIEYARDMISGQKNYITELRTPIFKYFIDLDIFDDEFYSGKKLFKIITKIQTALSYFFKRHNFNSDVYVCTTPPKNVKKDENEYVKTGVHLIWPYIHVTQEIALFLRQFIIQYLEKKLGERQNHNTWDDVIDESVYNQNGLRMIGSYKATLCRICKNKEPNIHGCNICFGIGRNLGIHTYTLTHIISDKKTTKKKALKEIQKQQSKMIQLLSIRTLKLKSNINIEEPYPSWFDINIASKKNKKVVGEILKKARFQRNACGKNNETVDDPVVLKTIEDFVKSTFGTKEYYKNISIKTVRKSTSARKECYWVATDSNYCLNVCRNHTSAEIYFEINFDKIVQRCFSIKKATHDRKNGVCKDFKSSKIFPVPLKIKKILFPEKYEDINNKHKSITGLKTEPNQTDKKEFNLQNVISASNLFGDMKYNFGFDPDKGNDSDIN